MGLLYQRFCFVLGATPVFLSRPIKGSNGQRHRRCRRHCSTIATDTTPTDAHTVEHLPGLGG
jgi:hypothetical protein